MLQHKNNWNLFFYHLKPSSLWDFKEIRKKKKKKKKPRRNNTCKYRNKLGKTSGSYARKEQQPAFYAWNCIIIHFYMIVANINNNKNYSLLNKSFSFIILYSRQYSCLIQILACSLIQHFGLHFFFAVFSLFYWSKQGNFTVKMVKITVWNRIIMNK